MIRDGEFLVITADEATALPDHELRENFRLVLSELYGDFGPNSALGDAFPFLREEPIDYDTIPTERMRRIVLERQEWFNPKPDVTAPNPEGEAMARAIRVLQIARYADEH